MASAGRIHRTIARTTIPVTTTIARSRRNRARSLNARPPRWNETLGSECDNPRSPGRSAAVAYLLWEQMVAGSIPAAPTKTPPSLLLRRKLAIAPQLKGRTGDHGGSGGAQPPARGSRRGPPSEAGRGRFDPGRPDQNAAIACSEVCPLGTGPRLVRMRTRPRP